MNTVKLQYDVTLSQMKNERGLTHEEIGDLLGVSKDTVRQMLIRNRQIYMRRIEGRWHFAEIKDWRRETGPACKNESVMAPIHNKPSSALMKKAKG